jgi:class 3 adenylate cyclase/hemoglobin-like flavoprotein
MEIRYACEDRVVKDATPGLTVLDISIANKIPHFRECGGHARCTTCRVRILDGLQHVSPRSPVETKVAQERGWDDLTRLACQTQVLGDVTLERLIKSGADVSHLQLETIPAELREELSLAILFCDIRNFTPFVERQLPYDVVHMLNRFFTDLGEPILLNNGVIYQYVGDEITGLFGVDREDPEKSCLNAIRAGLGMLEALQELNSMLAEDFGTTFEIGIGAHFGPTIVGHIGHPSHRQFAVVGDAINVASRVQAMNKSLGTRFLVSADLLNQIPCSTVEGKSTTAKLKGKHETFHLVEILGFKKPDPTLLVQETAGWILEQQNRFTDELYRRMFAIAPELKRLFHGDMQQQGQMVAHMLQVLVYAMSRPENMTLGLQALGQRHVDYGVSPEHYPVFRRAFLEALRVVLGEKCTLHVEEAWEVTIDAIIDVMLTGYEQPKRRQRRRG